jgi:hypothetical protein
MEAAAPGAAARRTSGPHRRTTSDPTGNCTYSSVHGINERHVHPLVSELVQTAFFRYFKVCTWIGNK